MNERYDKSDDLIEILRVTRLSEHATALGICIDGSDVKFFCTGQLHRGDAVDRNTLMYAASITKQFIGILVAQLVNNRVMNIDQSLREYLPELAFWADPIHGGTWPGWCSKIVRQPSIGSSVVNTALYIADYLAAASSQYD